MCMNPCGPITRLRSWVFTDRVVYCAAPLLDSSGFWPQIMKVKLLTVEQFILISFLCPLKEIHAIVKYTIQEHMWKLIFFFEHVLRNGFGGFKLVTTFTTPKFHQMETFHHKKLSIPTISLTFFLFSLFHLPNPTSRKCSKIVKN